MGGFSATVAIDNPGGPLVLLWTVWGTGFGGGGQLKYDSSILKLRTEIGPGKIESSSEETT